MERGLYFFKNYLGEGIFPFQGIERQRVHSPGSRMLFLLRDGPTLSCWNNVPQSFSKGQIEGLCGPAQLVQRCPRGSSLSTVIAIGEACVSSWQPESQEAVCSSKSQLEFFHFYFPAIEARQQRKIKVNYYMLWVSETSFCFLPRSCTVLRFSTAGSAPVSSPVAFHSHRAEPLLQTSN